jgi:serpin B
MKKALLIGTIVLFVAGVTTATVMFFFPYEPDNPPVTDETGATEEGIEEVISANNKFAFDLYSELVKSEDGNIFYSPYSISSALAMTYEGAKGKTKEEMKSVFYFPEDNVLRPNFAAIYNRINKDKKDYELRTGNALWVQQEYPFLEEYITGVEKYYGGKATNLDFVNETEQSRQTINSFIEEQTNNKIKELIPAGFLDRMTRLVLTNAIYFKGTWEWEFEEDDTYEDDFRITPDNTVKTEMMSMHPEGSKVKFNYLRNEDLKILELPYKGEDLSMLILLPNDNLESLEPNLTAEKIEEYRSQMTETELDLVALPKFEFDTKYFMKGTLSSLGMPTAFSGSADFSGMTGERDLFIDFVIHQAYVKVNEEGTEAAAATAVGMKLTAVPTPSEVFKADHPFIFLIQEKDNGNILFLGRVVDPTK